MSGQTLLIVDGDLTSVKYLTHMLQGQGYSILSAGLGKEALISIWRDRPELVIFDPILQDIPYEEFVQKIRHDPRSANIPVLA